MAYKEVFRVEITEVVRQWQTGRHIRGITRSTGLARNTIRKYILTAQSCGLARDGPPATELQLITLVQLNRAGPRQAAVPTDKVLEPWTDQIQQWLKSDRLKLTRIQELLAKEQCIAPYSSLRRFVIRRGWLGKSSRTTVRMADTAPGEVAEADFGRLGLIWDPESGRRRWVWGMLVVLGYSRHKFLWPLFRQQLVDVIEGLEACWAFFSGIPRYLVLDNFPAAVVGPNSLNPRLTRGFLEYAQHRGFITDPTRPGHPKDKPKVERQVPYARERFFKGGQFNGLTDLREQAKHWCLEVAGQRIHGTTRHLPLVVFQEEEQSKLLPHDGEPYDVPDWHTATVHPDHHIAYRYAIYSVPDNLCPLGTEVEVRGDTKLVRIYHWGALVKVHSRQPRGGRATDPEDYPAELTPYTTRVPDRIRCQAAELGPAIGAFADRLLGGPLPWAKLRQGHKLLRMAERYTPARLSAACEKALAVDLIDVRRLEHILVEALEDEALLTTDSLLPPPGRFARPGYTFAIHGNRGGNHDGDQIEGGLYEYHR